MLILLLPPLPFYYRNRGKSVLAQSLSDLLTVQEEEEDEETEREIGESNKRSGAESKK